MNIAIIPARMNSSRFPGKPLFKIKGIPMIGHTLARTRLAKSFDDVYVATCDKEILEYVHSIGGNAVMTSSSHERASDRTAEAVSKIESEIGQEIKNVAMVQGDEPLVNPLDLENAISLLDNDNSLEIVNLMALINSKESFEDKNEVKVVLDSQNFALYFSREPIPSSWHSQEKIDLYKQLGLIFFKRSFLNIFNALPMAPLERSESVDMLRVLENGYRVKMLLTNNDSIGVDNLNDASKAEKMLENDKLFPLYKNLLIPPSC